MPEPLRNSVNTPNEKHEMPAKTIPARNHFGVCKRSLSSLKKSILQASTPIIRNPEFLSIFATVEKAVSARAIY